MRSIILINNNQIKYQQLLSLFLRTVTLGHLIPQPKILDLDGLQCELGSTLSYLWKQGGTPLGKVSMASVHQVCHLQEIRPLGVNYEMRKHRRSCWLENSCVTHV